ncbi:hypothetical protein SAMN04487968_11611 [Nocardioides terrae]|uniref:Uncharacterized protein n=1 Tax=Nocardioides terrae TaxID=574651 RepID=A0A1I1NCU5_9ACTN|nr:hypothetical protein [Nocardioides terrae]SFC95062.1 hypothetical protein SAMN04487968_11611 [Nocardioides terrae]
MLVLLGEFRGVRSELVRRKDGSVVKRKDGTDWERREARLLTGRDGDYVQSVELLGDSLTDESFPAAGTMVALEVSIETRAVGERVYRTFKAWKRVPEVEAILPQPAGA